MFRFQFLLITALTVLGSACATSVPKERVSGKLGYDLPIVDLNEQTEMHYIVDKKSGVYLGHPTTHLCQDGKTIICVYPEGHGKGAVAMKKSYDGGKTWSERLPTPSSWAGSREVPTLYELEAPDGKRRVMMFSGIMGKDPNIKNRYAVSEDDGKTWSELINIPNHTAGIVMMADILPLRTGKGHYLATYHNNARGVDSQGRFGTLEQYVTKTTDGGMTWSDPKIIFPGTRTLHLCEGGLVRSPNGKEIALLLRENSRHHNAQIMFSSDEGETWTSPVPLPGALAGDRHQAIRLKDGRYLIQFRDLTPSKCADRVMSPTEGDWVGWVGTWEDLKNGYEGEYRIRFKDNHGEWDCGYPAAEMLPCGTLVCTSYGRFSPRESSYIMTLRFKIEELDNIARNIRKNGQPVIKNYLNNQSFNLAETKKDDIPFRMHIRSQ